MQDIERILVAACSFTRPVRIKAPRSRIRCGAPWPGQDIRWRESGASPSSTCCSSSPIHASITLSPCAVRPKASSKPTCRSGRRCSNLPLVARKSCTFPSTFQRQQTLVGDKVSRDASLRRVCITTQWCRPLKASCSTCPPIWLRRVHWFFDDGWCQS